MKAISYKTWNTLNIQKGILLIDNWKKQDIMAFIGMRLMESHWNIEHTASKENVPVTSLVAKKHILQLVSIFCEISK